MDTIELAKKMRELKWTGWDDPKFTEELAETGYAWVQGPDGTMIPSPSRMALVEEIIKLDNEQTYTREQLMNMGYAYEPMMQIWINLKEKNA